MQTLITQLQAVIPANDTESNIKADLLRMLEDDHRPDACLSHIEETYRNPEHETNPDAELLYEDGIAFLNKYPFLYND